MVNRKAKYKNNKYI